MQVVDFEYFALKIVFANHKMYFKDLKRFVICYIAFVKTLENMLAEVTMTAILRQKQPTIFRESKTIAREGGQVGLRRRSRRACIKTFTFDDKKHTEQSFRKSLSNTLKHLVQRKGWKYIGVWERSKNERLHFHGIFVIPQMIGKLETVTDYDTRKHRKQTILQNTHFAERYGRNDFKEICPFNLEVTVKYVVKYIEKSGEKLVYGGDLPEYIDCNVLAEDVVCTMGKEDRKILLFDDFTCIDKDGVVRGKATSEVLAQMPKAN